LQRRPDRRARPRPNRSAARHAGVHNDPDG
jgi:hypothetical protein